VLHASLFPVQPWLDVPDLGFAALVCADGDVSTAQAEAERLADMVWKRRDSFEPDLTSLEDAIRTGLTSSGCTVVSDSGDCPSGGAAADSAAVLRALLDEGADRARGLSYLSICDPRVVSEAARAGPGATLTTRVGHFFSKNDGEPVTITALVRLISDGEYQMRHANLGTPMRMGPTAVLQIGSIRLIVRSVPAMEWDVNMFLSQGLDPVDATLVFVKSPSAFRKSFASVAARILVADTPGATRADVRRIPYRAVTRPLYPLDDIGRQP
jgi:microcystin degradation protein MlrC